MDAMQGMLISGMLGGNLIAAQFNLGWMGIEVQELPEVRGGTQALGGAGRPNLFAPAREQKKKLLVISIRFRGEITKKTYEISDRSARVSINTLKLINRAKDVTMRVFVREQTEIKTPVVRIKDD